MRLLPFLLLFMLGISSCFFPKPAQPMHTNQSYGPYQRNKMDVYFPTYHDSSTAVVMLVHGGGWVAGNKTDWTAEIINTITQQGYAVATINYRYADGDFHHQMQDVQMAVNYVNAHAADWKTAQNKLALIGASAGGHLSLLFGHGFDSTNAVKAVVSLAGPTDMTDSVFYQYANNYQIGYVFQQLTGVPFDGNSQVYRDASPSFYHRNVPSLFIHGSLDNLVPATQSQRMYDSLRVYNITADTTFFSNAGHDVFGTNVTNKQQIFNKVKSWLQLYLH